jgi:multidrug transporter EmrE-like cation transporter
MMNIEIKAITLEVIKNILSSFYVWFGLCCYGISFIIYLYILSKFEVSYIYPIIMSAGFVLLLIFSTLFLGKILTLKKIIGIAVISAGLFIITY